MYLHAHVCMCIYICVCWWSKHCHSNSKQTCPRQPILSSVWTYSGWQDVGCEGGSLPVVDYFSWISPPLPLSTHYRFQSCRHWVKPRQWPQSWLAYTMTQNFTYCFMWVLICGDSSISIPGLASSCTNVPLSLIHHYTTLYSRQGHHLCIHVSAFMG